MRAPRGQNLVLLSLAMLFLALMITMTLGLGLRIRQRHELQNLADAAAYSNAVMTARAFNNMATINRLEVSYWAAQAADQALISYAAYGQALANAASTAASNASCGNANDQKAMDQFHDDLETYITNRFESGAAKALWNADDENAGTESRGLQGTIAGLRAELTNGVGFSQQGTVKDRLFNAVKAQQLTEQVIARSGTDDVTFIKAPGDSPQSPEQLSLKELDCEAGGGQAEYDGLGDLGSGLCLNHSWGRNMIDAAMGTRGDFASVHSNPPSVITGEVDGVASGNSKVTVSFSGAGAGYWAETKSGGLPYDGTYAWGQDDGEVTVRYGNCSKTVAAHAHVFSTDIDLTNDQHIWTKRPSGLDPLPEERHTMGDCGSFCPSVWVRTVGFKPDYDAVNVWGQPKTVVALSRDLTKHPHKWELNFKFPFSAAGPAGSWDGRGLKLASQAGHGLSVAEQTAVSTGIIYYHHAGYWNEFPNLLNPFWRAALAASDVDGTTGDSAGLRAALGQPQYQWQTRAVKALQNVGYEGLH